MRVREECSVECFSCGFPLFILIPQTVGFFDILSEILNSLAL